MPSQANAQCYNLAEKLDRMGKIDDSSMVVCGCSCVHKCPVNMKQVMGKFIDVFRSGKHMVKSDDLQRKPLHWHANAKTVAVFPLYRMERGNEKVT